MSFLINVLLDVSIQHFFGYSTVIEELSVCIDDVTVFILMLHLNVHALSETGSSH